MRSMLDLGSSCACLFSCARRLVGPRPAEEMMKRIGFEEEKWNLAENSVERDPVE
jgi:hypothetical protein